MTETPGVVVADAGYRNDEQMDTVVSGGIPVLIPPDAGDRNTPRAGGPAAATTGCAPSSRPSTARRSTANARSWSSPCSRRPNATGDRVVATPRPIRGQFGMAADHSDAHPAETPQTSRVSWPETTRQNGRYAACGAITGPTADTAGHSPASRATPQYTRNRPAPATTPTTTTRADERRVSRSRSASEKQSPVSVAPPRSGGHRAAGAHRGLGPSTRLRRGTRRRTYAMSAGCVRARSDRGHARTSLPRPLEPRHHDLQSIRPASRTRPIASHYWLGRALC